MVKYNINVKPQNAVFFFCLNKTIKVCQDEMRTLRINDTNVHHNVHVHNNVDSQVQNDVDIYKILTSNRDKYEIAAS